MDDIEHYKYELAAGRLYDPEADVPLGLDPWEGNWEPVEELEDDGPEYTAAELETIEMPF